MKRRRSSYHARGRALWCVPRRRPVQVRTAIRAPDNAATDGGATDGGGGGGGGDGGGVVFVNAFTKHLNGHSGP